MINLSDFIAQSKGKFITVTFVKKDGSVRKLNGRIGVTKHLKNGTSTVDHNKYFVVYDNKNAGYRCVNKDTVKQVSCEGVTISYS